MPLQIMNVALGGVAQWIECWPVNRRVAGSIPSLTLPHAWVAGQVRSRGCMRGNHTLIFPSLSYSLPLSLKINLKKR